MRVKLKFLFLILLIFLSACKVKFEGLDPCIKEIDVTIKQGSVTQRDTTTVTNGKGEMSLDSSIDKTKVVEVSFKVKSVHNKPACRERESQIKNKVYRFNAIMPKDSEDTPLLKLPQNLSKTKPVTPSAGGKVEGGTLPPPRTRGTGELGIGMWTEGITGCTKICWEQWANARVFFSRDGGGYSEILNGEKFPNKITGPNTYGKFDRDLLPGWPNNCYQLGNIPTKKSQKGIIDMPGHDVADSATLNSLFQAGKTTYQALPGGRPFVAGSKFSLRYDFDMYSVLICQNPAPRKTIGFYHWQTQQTVDFSKNQNVSWKAKYAIPMRPAWTNRKTALPGAITAPPAN